MTVPRPVNGRPPCYNRGLLAPTATYNTGLSSDGRQLTGVFPFRMSRGCKTWAGRAIGPTPETDRYPQAHRFDCRGCELLPPEHREDAEAVGRLIDLEVR